MPRWLYAAYVAKQGVNHCPTSVEQLKKDLIDVEPQARQFKKVADDVKALKSGSPNKKSSGSEGGTANASGTTKKRSLKDPIPKKVRNDKTEGKESLLDSYKKHCNHCQRFSPKIAHTHNTKDCRRWNPDGTPKAKKAKTSHALQKLEHEQFKAVFAQMQEDNKKLRKLLKKQTKKSKSRKRKAYDTSDDTGSDSSEQDVGSYDHSVLHSPVGTVCNDNTDASCTVDLYASKTKVPKLNENSDLHNNTVPIKVVDKTLMTLQKKDS